MVSFYYLAWLSMSVPYYLKCKTCKYVYFISPYQAKCRRFLFLNNPYIVNENKEVVENDLYLDIEIARGDNGICGKNASYYEQRLHQ